MSKKVACLNFLTPCQNVSKNVSKRVKTCLNVSRNVSKSVKTCQNVSTRVKKKAKLKRYANFACQNVSKRVKNSFRVKTCQIFLTLTVSSRDGSARTTASAGGRRPRGAPMQLPSRRGGCASSRLDHGLKV